MNKYLRYFALLLALCLFLTACGGGNSGDSKVETPDEPKVETPDEPKAEAPDAPVPHNAQMLLSNAEPLADMEATKRERYDNGSYYYMDVAGENALRCISSCYQTTLREDETEEEYAQRRAIGMAVTMSPGNPYNLSVAQIDELSEGLGYPVYLVTFLTGADQNATCWTIYLTRTEHYSYQYAFAAVAQTSLELEDQIVEYFRTLRLEPMPEA